VENTTTKDVERYLTPKQIEEVGEEYFDSFIEQFKDVCWYNTFNSSIFYHPKNVAYDFINSWKKAHTENDRTFVKYKAWVKQVKTTPIAGKDEFLIWNYERWLCKQDMYYLGKMVLGYIHMASLHRDVTLWYIRAKQLFLREMAAFIARGHFKSTLFTIVKNMQNHLKDPSVRNITFTAGEDLGSEFMGELQNKYEIEKVHYLFPELVPENPRHSKLCKFSPKELYMPRRKDDPRRGPTTRIITERSTDTGIHGDRVTGDDFVNEENHDTETKRLRTKRKVGKILSYKDSELISPDNEALWVGTPYHPDDAICSVVIPEVLRILDNETVERWEDRIAGPFITDNFYFMPSHWMKDDRGEYVPANIEDESIEHQIELAFPEAFTVRELRDRKRKGDLIDEAIFRTQYELVVATKESRPFGKPTPDHYYDVEDLDDNRKQIIVGDLAVPGKHNDKTAIILLSANTDSKVYIEDYHFGWFTEDEMIGAFHDLVARSINLKSIMVESDVGFSYLADQIEKKLRKPIDRFHTTDRTKPGELGRSKSQISKDAYILHMASSFKKVGIRLKFEHKELIKDLTNFPTVRYDDLLDAMAIGWHHAIQHFPKTKEEIIRTTTYKGQFGERKQIYTRRPTISEEVGY
jgi:hypothetical protein